MGYTNRDLKREQTLAMLWGWEKSYRAHSHRAIGRPGTAPDHRRVGRPATHRLFGGSAYPTLVRRCAGDSDHSLKTGRDPRAEPPFSREKSLLPQSQPHDCLLAAPSILRL